MDHFAGLFTQFIIAIDPIGTIPVLLWVSIRMSNQQKVYLALRACTLAGLILLLFMFLGRSVLTLMEVHLGEFMIAGGIVLFLFSCDMVFGISKPEKEKNLVSGARDLAVFPLAVPSLASPAVLIQVTMVAEYERLIWHDRLLPVLSLLSALSVTLLILVLAIHFSRLLPSYWLSAASRLMGLLLAALAIKYIHEGFKSLGSTDLAYAGSL